MTQGMLTNRFTAQLPTEDVKAGPARGRADCCTPNRQPENRVRFAAKNKRGNYHVTALQK